MIRPAYPAPMPGQFDPVGLAEIAKALGLPRSTVAAHHLAGELPPPRWTVDGHPAWRWRDIEDWAETQNRLE